MSAARTVLVGIGMIPESWIAFAICVAFFERGAGEAHIALEVAAIHVLFQELRRSGEILIGANAKVLLLVEARTVAGGGVPCIDHADHLFLESINFHVLLADLVQSLHEFGGAVFERLRLRLALNQSVVGEAFLRGLYHGGHGKCNQEFHLV